MPEPTTQNLVSTLLPVVIGGLIGLAGGWLGPWLLEGRKEASEKKSRRIEKFEEFVATIYEHEHWLEKIRGHRIYRKAAPEGMSPFARIEALCLTHFPEFEVKVKALETAARDYEIWMTEEGQKNLPKDESIKDRFGEVFDPYWKKNRDLLDALREYAKKEFQ
jgi:hypothetical protein